MNLVLSMLSQSVFNQFVYKYNHINNSWIEWFRIPSDMTNCEIYMLEYENTLILSFRGNKNYPEKHLQFDGFNWKETSSHGVLQKPRTFIYQDFSVLNAFKNILQKDYEKYEKINTNVNIIILGAIFVFCLYVVQNCINRNKLAPSQILKQE